MHLLNVKQKKRGIKMEEKIESQELLELIRIAVKDILIAVVRKNEDELKIKFPNGQTFTLALWENKR